MFMHIAVISVCATRDGKYYSITHLVVGTVCSNSMHISQLHLYKYLKLFYLQLLHFAWADQKVQQFYNYHNVSKDCCCMGSYKMLE